MIACGLKHTLMLDSIGNIWFWGNKLSVGIKDEDHEDQKHPKILMSYYEEGPFMYISTNHTKNIAVTNTGYMISFGVHSLNEESNVDSENDNFQYAESG